jgi:hypothetical protein
MIVVCITCLLLEVAALVVGYYDAADFDRDIVVEYHSGMLKIQIWVSCKTINIITYISYSAFGIY